MSQGLDLHKLRARALLMRHTRTTTEPSCRTATVQDVEYEGRTTKLIELAFFATHGTWAVVPASLKPGCPTPDCVMHLVFEDPDDEDIQMVETRRRTRTLGEMFRDGRSRGWFKGGSSYAN